VSVRASYAYPDIVDPNDRSRHLSPAIREVKADPTARADGTRRFAVSFDLFPGEENGDPVPGVIQEFAYDPAAADPLGAIRPVSAPVLPGGESSHRDPGTGVSRYQGYGALLYDHLGNLWVGTGDTPYASSDANSQSSEPLAVFRSTDGERKLATTCRFVPGSDMSSYTSPGSATVWPAWGATCPPDHRVMQARELGWLWGLVEDPSTSPTTVTVAELGFNGLVMPVQLTTSTNSFKVGTIADSRAIGFPVQPGFALNSRIGAVDPNHRMWFTVQQLQGGGTDVDRVTAPQWLHSLSLTDLLAPPPTPLPGTGGRSVTIQAENAATISTHAGTSPGDIVSDAYKGPCVELTADLRCPGSLGLQGPGGFRDGVPDGTTVDYRVTVPAGTSFPATYRAVFRVLAQRDCGQTFPCGRIDLANVTAGTAAVSTPFTTFGFADVTASADLSFTAPGTKTIRITAPAGGGGWVLNSFTLTR
jgi:hypothetical protein